MITLEVDLPEVVLIQEIVGYDETFVVVGEVHRVPPGVFAEVDDRQQSLNAFGPDNRTQEKRRPLAVDCRVRLALLLLRNHMKQRPLPSEGRVGCFHFSKHFVLPLAYRHQTPASVRPNACHSVHRSQQEGTQ